MLRMQVGSRDPGYRWSQPRYTIGGYSGMTVWGAILGTAEAFFRIREHWRNQRSTSGRAIGCPRRSRRCNAGCQVALQSAAVLFHFPLGGRCFHFIPGAGPIGAVLGQPAAFGRGHTGATLLLDALLLLPLGSGSSGPALPIGLFHSGASLLDAFGHVRSQRLQFPLQCLDRLARLVMNVDSLADEEQARDHDRDRGELDCRMKRSGLRLRVERWRAGLVPI